jgi:putative flippase GtrA
LRRFVRFLFVGVLNTAFGYVVYVAVWFGWNSATASVIVANIMGTAFNYFTVGRLVFANRGFKAFLPFVLGYVLVLVINLALVEWLTRIGVGALIAQLISTPVLIVFSFVFNSLITFRSRR